MNQSPSSSSQRNPGNAMKNALHAYENVSNLDAGERERLLMEQLPQVRYIARRIHDRLPPHIPFEDLVHAGVLGLIAVPLGISGLRKRRQNPVVRGAVHAWVGIILGSLVILAHVLCASGVVARPIRRSYFRSRNPDSSCVIGSISSMRNTTRG